MGRFLAVGHSAWRRLFPSHHDAWVFANLSIRLVTRGLTVMILARLLPSQSIAVWFVFLSVFGLASLAEGGFGKIVSREVAYRGGACGPDVAAPPEVITFVAAAAAVYAVLITLVCILGGIAGVVWFKWGMHLGSEPHLYFAWAIFILGSAVALMSSFVAAVVVGVQDVAAAQKSSSAGAVVSMVVVLSMLMLTDTLLAPAAGLLCASTTSLWLNRRRLRNFNPETGALFVNRIKSSHLQVVRGLLPDMGRMLLMMTAYQALTSVFIVLLSAYSTLALVASFGLTMQLVTIVVTFADTWMTALYPRLAAARGQGAGVLRRLAIPAMARGATFVVIGLMALLILGPWLMRQIGSQTNLLEGTVLAVLLLAIGTEYLFSVMAQVPISQGDLRLAYFSAAAALAAVAAALALLSSGTSIADVFAARLIIYTAVCGIPTAVFCARFLTEKRLVVR